MVPDEDARLAREIAAAAVPLTGARRDYDALLDSIGDARVVMLGEATHGTHEFHRLRATPLERTAHWDLREPAETYPTGM